MTTRSELLAKRARHVARLDKFNDQADDLADDSRKGYTMDTGDGRISGFFRSLEDIQKAIYREEREIESIDRRLKGPGITSTRLRRYC